MSALSRAAMSQLAESGITRAQWIEWCHGPGETTWRGDRCGCSDDRCIGFHHDEHEDCGCLPAMIADRARDYRAGRDAQQAWDEPMGAMALDRWVTVYQPAATAHRIVRVHDGTRMPGIWVTNRWSDQEHLVWRPGMDRLVRWTSDLTAVEVPS